MRFFYGIHMTTLRQAAQAVVKRWTVACYVLEAEMSELRKALEAPEPDLYCSYIAVCEELVKRTEEREALMAAGKLTLKAMEELWKDPNPCWSDMQKAITALKSAGVE